MLSWLFCHKFNAYRHCTFDTIAFRVYAHTPRRDRERDKNKRTNKQIIKTSYAFTKKKTNFSIVSHISLSSMHNKNEESKI